ncbi:Hypothetical predicted protein [Olea europaea subsp. europaea]|uniref:Uncharacterized protein n=1 Tax=Olea europaea subsp. europaea TaxID=158383 RepID=A0A8S0TLU6_OLEEU|nr:Hypothetical predicted protein [Olea europaea subsp. europaea]
MCAGRAIVLVAGRSRRSTLDAWQRVDFSPIFDRSPALHCHSSSSSSSRAPALAGQSALSWLAAPLARTHTHPAGHGDALAAWDHPKSGFLCLLPRARVPPLAPWEISRKTLRERDFARSPALSRLIGLLVVVPKQRLARVHSQRFLEFACRVVAQSINLMSLPAHTRERAQEAPGRYLQALLTRAQFESKPFLISACLARRGANSAQSAQPIDSFFCAIFKAGSVRKSSKSPHLAESSLVSSLRIAGISISSGLSRSPRGKHFADCDPSYRARRGDPVRTSPQTLSPQEAAASRARPSGPHSRRKGFARRMPKHQLSHTRRIQSVWHRPGSSRVERANNEQHWRTAREECLNAIATCGPGLIGECTCSHSRWLCASTMKSWRLLSHTSAPLDARLQAMKIKINNFPKNRLPCCSTCDTHRASAAPSRERFAFERVPVANRKEQTRSNVFARGIARPQKGRENEIGRPAVCASACAQLFLDSGNLLQAWTILAGSYQAPSVRQEFDVGRFRTTGCRVGGPGREARAMAAAATIKGAHADRVTRRRGHRRMNHRCGPWYAGMRVSRQISRQATMRRPRDESSIGGCQKPASGTCSGTGWHRHRRRRGRGLNRHRRRSRGSGTGTRPARPESCPVPCAPPACANISTQRAFQACVRVCFKSLLLLLVHVPPPPPSPATHAGRPVADERVPAATQKRAMYRVCVRKALASIMMKCRPAAKPAAATSQAGQCRCSGRGCVSGEGAHTFLRPGMCARKSVRSSSLCQCRPLPPPSWPVGRRGLSPPPGAASALARGPQRPRAVAHGCSRRGLAPILPLPLCAICAQFFHAIRAVGLPAVRARARARDRRDASGGAGARWLLACWLAGWRSRAGEGGGKTSTTTTTAWRAARVSPKCNLQRPAARRDSRTASERARTRPAAEYKSPPTGDDTSQ